MLHRAGQGTDHSLCDSAAWVQVRRKIRFLRCIAHVLKALGPDTTPLSTCDSLRWMVHLVATDGCVDV